MRRSSSVATRANATACASPRATTRSSSSCAAARSRSTRPSASSPRWTSPSPPACRSGRSSWSAPTPRPCRRASPLLRRPGPRLSSAGAACGGPPAAIVGDKRSGTLVIAASDEDFEQIKSMAQTFDAPSKARDFQFRVIPLEHARVGEVRTAITNLVEGVQEQDQGFDWWWGGGSRNNDEKDKLVVEFKRTRQQRDRDGPGGPLRLRRANRPGPGHAPRRRGPPWPCGPCA